MTTYEESGGMGWRPLLVILVVAAMALLGTAMLAVYSSEVTPATDTSHAFKRHGDHAVTARQCSQDPNNVRFFNPTTNRIGLSCQIDSKWYIIIYDALGEEVTAFQRSSATKVKHIYQYMKNAGYNPMP